jgi:hypothetical protein
MLGVAEALFAVRFTSTSHGVPAEPHVLLALHNCSGCASLQAYLLFFDCAKPDVASKTSADNSNVRPIAMH